MCTANLKPTDDNGLPRLFHLTVTPAELNYISMGLLGNMAAAQGGLLIGVMHSGEVMEFAEDHDIKEIHDGLNKKFAPLMGLAMCEKCLEFHAPDCEAHNEHCDGLKGVTL